MRLIDLIHALRQTVTVNNTHKQSMNSLQYLFDTYYQLPLNEEPIDHDDQHINTGCLVVRLILPFEGSHSNDLRHKMKVNT